MGLENGKLPTLSTGWVKKVFKKCSHNIWIVPNLISSSMLTLPLIPDAHAARRDVSPTGPHQCTQDTARLAKTISGKQIL